MPSSNILVLKKQTGVFTAFDSEACYQDLKEACMELLQQHQTDWQKPQPMFRLQDGILQIWEGEDSECWGNTLNVWGYDSEWILSEMAKHLKGEGRVIAISSPEGNSASVYEITAGKCETIA